MRTISLTEHESKAEALSERELAQLLATKFVGVSPRPDGLYDLRAGSTVGTVVFADLRLLIRPKVGLPNVFFLLFYGGDLTVWGEESFPYVEDDFLQAIAWLVEAETRRAASTGLVRDYREHEEALATVRGRIDLGAQIRRRQGRAIPLDCRYQEYGEDTELNRVVKAALRRLLCVPGLDGQLALDLRHHQRLFAGVADVDYPPSAVPTLAFNRLNEAWRPAARLAQLVLRADSVRDATGSFEAISFTVDMNRLFERFVETVAREESRRRGWELEAQGTRRLTESVAMRPDLILRRDAVDCAVGDAKYKRLAPADWPHADLYQLLAYCVALRLRYGLLIYADAEQPRSETVHEAGVTIDIVGVDLAARPAVVLSETRGAAGRLIGHARAHWPTSSALREREGPTARD
jgi:5-methylcytosine-specific restriction enzyme subunit McrC